MNIMRQGEVCKGRDRVFLLPALFVLTVAVGCGVPPDIGRTADSVDIVVPHKGASHFGQILEESDSTLTIAVADTRDTLLIDRGAIRSSALGARRRQMLVSELSWNPAFSFYRSLAPAVNVGITARYQWKGLWIGEVKAVESATELRILPFGRDMRGFYLAGYLAYASVVADRSRHSFSSWWSDGYLFGWQWFPMYNVAAGVAFGFERWHFDSEPAYSEVGYIGSGLARFQIGYAW